MKKLYVCLAVLGVTAVSVGVAFGVSSQSSSTFYKVGKEAREYDLSDKKQLVAEGANIEVSLEELEFRMNLQQIDNNSADCDEILQELIQEKTLYQKAVSEGVTMEESEAEKQVQQLKDMMSDAENADQVRDLIKGFGDEEAYWDYTKERIRVKGSIQNYEELVKSEYAEKENIKEDQAEAKLEQQVEDLVKQEKVEIKKPLVQKLKAEAQ